MTLARLAMFIGILFLPALSQQIYYSEDFEGPITMTVTGGGWEFGTPSVVGPTTVPDGDSCAGTIIAGNYANGANYQMMTPSISLPNIDTIKLSYFDWYQLESCCDRISVDIEQNSSGTWNSLWTTQGSTAAWTRQSINLSSYKNSTVRLRFTLTSDGSVTYPGWYIDNIIVYHPAVCSLTVVSGTGGTTSPTGKVVVETGIPQTISATPGAGYRFNNWTVTSGSPTIASSTSYSTTATIAANAAVQANFTAGVIHTLTGFDSTYNFTTHYFSGVDPSGGAAFSFTAPAAGSYAIVVSDVQSSSKYLYYYGTSSAFSSYVDYRSGSGTLTYLLTATAGTTYYFKVAPSSSSYWPNNFTIRCTTTPTLTVANDGNCTTSPSGAIAVVAGVSQAISATPIAGYRFVSWTTTGGSPTIANAASYSTTVTLTADGAIRANAVAGVIHALTGIDSTYNFTTHYYSGVDPSGGVAFRFTAPAAGSYIVTLSDVQTSSKYLYYYGTSSTFASVVSSQSGTGTLSLLITASAGVTYYFKVLPSSSSYWSSNFAIHYATAPTLTVANDGHGTTSPSGSLAVLSGVAQSILATPGTGYRFNNWTVTSGSATIATATSYSTTTTITSDATVQANFTAGVIHTLTGFDSTYNFTTHYYSGVDPSGGAAVRFTAPTAGNYVVILSDVQTSSKYLYYYGTSSTFASVVSSQSGTGTLSLMFTATAGGAYYFKVIPSSSSYWANNFTIRCVPAPVLTVTNDGSGSTSPTGSSPVLPGIAQSIASTPNAGYRFNNWTISSGSPTIANALMYSTTVTLSGDATVRANCAPGVIHTLTGFDSTCNFTTYYYSGVDPSGGVAVRFTAPTAGSFNVVLRDTLTTSSKALYYYGADSTFNSVVDSRSGTGTLTLAFSASSAGQKAYFKVVPGSSTYWPNNFKIRCSIAPTLTVTNDGHGSTSPSGGVAVISGIAQNISATPATEYRFNKWTVTGGSAVIADTTAASTTVTITDNASIKANFSMGTIYGITASATIYNFTTHYFDINPGNGVRLKLIAPAAGSYCVTVKNIDTASLYFRDYGADSTFTTFLHQQNSSSWSLTFTVTLAVGETRYFKVAPLTSSYWTKRFSIAWSPGLSLTPSSVSATLNPGQTLAEHKVLHLPADVSPPMADIFFIMDLTSSMTGALSNVKTNSVNIMNQLRGLIPDSRFGAMSHMDYNGTFSGCGYNSTYGAGSDVPYRLNQRLTDSINAVSVAINAESIADGEDGPEDYTRPLSETYSDTAIHWRPGAKRIVLLWGDNLPHDCAYGLDCGLTGGNNGPDPGRDGIVGTADDLNLADVLAKMAQNNITLIALHSGTYLPYWSCYAGKTGGNAFQINSDGSVPSGTDIATYITGLIHENVKHIDTLKLSICTAGFESWLTSSLPARYSGLSLDTARDFPFDITLQVPSGTLPGVYNFNVCARGDGVEYASQQVAITVPGGANNPPVANAGSDQSVAAGSGCAVSVTLNGSASHDPDGDPLTYAWRGPFSETLSGAMPTVSLSTGVNAIVLTVHDTKGDSAWDTVQVTVVDNTPPVPNVPTLPALRGNCSVDITAMPKPTATDNCSGIITGATADPLTYSRQGSYAVHWTYRDGNGNSSTQTQTILVKDTIAPAPDISSLPVRSGQCSAAVTDTPTATDGCAGKIKGTTADPLFYNAQGTYAVHWTYADGNGNSSTQDQTVRVRDTLAPQPVKAFLAMVSGQCSAAITDTPSATDACSGTIKGATTDPLSYSVQGTYTVHWTYTDGNANVSTQNQTIVVRDTIAPLPNVSSLPVVRGNCSVTLTSPSATDNCSGSIAGATTDPLSYSSQGTYTVHWTYTDGNGNVSTQNQTVVVRDTIGPTPDIAALPIVRGGCSAAVTAPTATDNCAGPVVGTTVDPLTYTAQGTYTVHWTYADGHGNTSAQDQTVVVRDTIGPTPDIAALPIVRGGCSAAVNAPTATDNCTGPVVGTTVDPLTYTAQGTYTVHWTYADGHGNTATQNQTVVVRDTLAPVPDASTLPVLSGQCSAAVTDTPTATDVCFGKIKGTTSDPLSYASQGTYTVHWTFSDGVASSTQNQTIIVKDTIAPAPNLAALPTVRGGCSVTLSAPTATDNCSGTIPGVTADPLTYSQDGTYTVHWSYNDGHGNGMTQSQTVIVDDTVPPVPETDPLPPLRGSCSVTLVPPFAQDACAGRITATTAGPLTISAQGTHTIVWRYDDGRGNASTQNQTVIVRDTLPPAITVRNDTTLTVSALKDGAFVRLDSASAIDDCSPGSRQARRSDGLALDSAFAVGTTGVWWKACDAAGNCDSALQKVVVVRNRVPFVGALRDTAMAEGEAIVLRITAGDSDKTVPRITASDLPPGSVFIDSANGSGLFSWTPGCNDHGVYAPKFHASDGLDSAAAGFQLTVRDIDFPPRIDSIGNQKVLENHPLNLTVRSTDCDGTIPRLRAVSLPSGAEFHDNGNGTGSFSWTPACDANGYYIVIFEAVSDGTAVRDTIIVNVEDVNCYKPELTLSSVDMTVGINLPLTIIVRGSDGDGIPPSLAAGKLPSGASFESDGAGNGILRWTPRVAGAFAPVISAVDAADPAVIVDTVVKITVEDKNVTGPHFLPCKDKFIDENQMLAFSLTAIDSDGTIPSLRLIAAPAGMRFTDNSDGSGSISWQPGCDGRGVYRALATATDGFFTDTVTVGITVRDVNCPPVINPVSRKNVAYGKLLRFTVSASDPDNDGAEIDLSVSCMLPGFTFDMAGDGSAVFQWVANLPSGAYPATFYASDGYLTDSCTATIAVDKTGSIRLFAQPPAARIYASPTATLPGIFIGRDSALYTGAPGTYWFRAEAPGQRPCMATATIRPDTTTICTLSLKPTIPLMLVPPETLTVGSAADIAGGGSIAFVDYDGDGIQDLSVASGNEIRIFQGVGDAAGLQYHIPPITIAASPGMDSIVSHTYGDWNDDGEYECIISVKGGRILVASFDNEMMTSVQTIIDRPGETLFPTIIDENKDDRKDLLVLSAGKGLYLYRNSGSDSVPRLDTTVGLLDSSVAAADRLNGTPLFFDVDGDGSNDLILSSGLTIKVFAGGGDSTLRSMPQAEELNGGGERMSASLISRAILIAPDRLPRLVVMSGTKALAFPLRLQGDVTGDGVVDVRDIGRITKAWEKIPSDPEWNPLFNLKLGSDPANEIIDIRDVSRATKCWELRE